MGEFLWVLLVVWALCAWATGIALFVRWVIRWLMPAPTTVVQVTVNGHDTGNE